MNRSSIQTIKPPHNGFLTLQTLIILPLLIITLTQTLNLTAPFIRQISNTCEIIRYQLEMDAIQQRLHFLISLAIQIHSISPSQWQLTTDTQTLFITLKNKKIGIKRPLGNTQYISHHIPINTLNIHPFPTGYQLTIKTPKNEHITVIRSLKL